MLDRPEPGAVWPKGLNYKKWDKADASFETTGKKKGFWQNNVGCLISGTLSIDSPGTRSS